MPQNTRIISVPAESAATLQSLTQYPSGSLRELWSISFPLMLSLLSGSLMLFCDRLILANYSIDALTASATATLIASAIQFFFISTTAIAEVFVGQHNGARCFQKVGEPVWQMMWFSLMTTALFWPLGFWGAPYILHAGATEGEIQCFSWLMFFGPVFCLVGSLTAFYVGLGRVRFVTVSVVAANIVNICVDILLIFGWPPYIPSLGMVGAAIATGIAQLIQLTILFIDFIRKDNQSRFATGRFAFKPQALLQCLKVALPNSMTHTLEIFAWAALFQMMLMASKEHLTVIAVSQSIFFLFTFITDGVSKGATAIAANLIGAKRWDLVWKLLWSGIRFYFAVFLLLSVVLVVNPTPVIHWFIPDEQHHLAVKMCVSSTCLWIWLFFFFDGVNWLIVGVLTAAGDTKFILKVGGSTPWLFAIIPTYFAVVVNGGAADLAWKMIALYSILTCIIYCWRLQSGKWKHIVITD